MGKLKDQLHAQPDEDTAAHKLQDIELNHLKLCNTLLDILRPDVKQKVMSNYLYTVAVSRLGYAPGTELEFSLDFAKDDGLLTVSVVNS